MAFPKEGDGSLNEIFAAIPCAIFPKPSAGVYIISSDTPIEQVAFGDMTILELLL